MIYLSNLLNQKVWDAFGHVVGQVEDFLVSHTDQAMPPIDAILLKRSKTDVKLIDGKQIVTLWPSITLNTANRDLKAYQPHGHELHLKQRVLDQQIVDTEGKRLVRVNDVVIARKNQQYLVTGVDTGMRGLLRRLSLDVPSKFFAKLFKIKLTSQIIAWEDVASIEHDDPLRLKVSQDRLVQMEPVDIAAILDGLDHHTSKAILQGFDDEILADTLEQSSFEVQQAVLAAMEPERAADVLEVMDPDEAADLLADLDDEQSEQLLSLMEDEDEEEMRRLLAYPEDSAGGIMTTEFAWVPAEFTVEMALNHLRTSEEAKEDEFMYYLYILDSEQKLEGVVSLRDLVTAPLDKPLVDWTDDDVVHVEPHTDQNETAYLVAKYDLLAIPVIEPETQKMLGIVTVDDALDTVLPTAWKKRLPRFAGK